MVNDAFRAGRRQLNRLLPQVKANRLCNDLAFAECELLVAGGALPMSAKHFALLVVLAGFGSNTFEPMRR